MEPTATGPILTVTATDPESRDLKLEAAVAAMKDHGRVDGQRGILVTREAPGVLTVELRNDVPFGLILERDAMGKR
jgi:hypothetical protein